MKNIFLKNFAVTSISNIVLLIFALLNNVIITRWLGPEGRGVYAVVTTLVIFINLILGDGLRRSNTIIIGNDSSKFNRLIIYNLFYSLLIIFLLTIAFIFREYILLFFPNISSTLLLLTFVISIFSILWQAIQGIYLGLQKIIFFNILMISSALIVLIMNFVGIAIFEISLFGILQNMFIANLVVYLIGLLGFWGKSFKEEKSTKYKIFVQLFLSSKSTLSAIANYLVLRSGIFFVNAILGKAEAGYFSVAFIFFDLIQKLPNVAGTLVFSKIANKGEESSYSNIAKVVRIILFFSIIVSFIFMMLGQEIIIVLFGKEFQQSNEILRYMIFGLIFSGPGSVIHSYFMGIGFPRRMLIQNSVVAVFALSSNYLLINYFGLYGAGLSYSLIFSLWSIYYMVLFIKSTNLRAIDVLLIRKHDIMIIKEYIFSLSEIFKR